MGSSTKMGHRVKMSQSERAEQTQLIAWADATGDPRLRFLHASLNGELLTTGQARKAQRSGMRPGVPDLFLPVPVGDAHGLFLEMKTRRGRVSPEQRAWIAWLRAAGYQVEVCHAWWEARDVIVEYLRGATA